MTVGGLAWQFEAMEGVCETVLVRSHLGEQLYLWLAGALISEEDFWGWVVETLASEQMELLAD